LDNRTYGYVRVSAKDQNEARQVNALLEAGVSKRDIFIDKASGKDFKRENYLLLRDKILREGDLLVILSIDRLGRNYTEIQNEWRYITQEIKADIKVLDMPLLDTRSSAHEKLDSRFIADLVLQILSYVAEKERENIKKRQEQGIAAAKAAGKHLGRPKAKLPDNFSEIYNIWKEEKITAKRAMEELGLKRTTFYKLVKEYEETKK
jgi:DNA invertase Pin-like site-specific DNA recombinase